MEADLPLTGGGHTSHLSLDVDDCRRQGPSATEGDVVRHLNRRHLGRFFTDSQDSSTYKEASVLCSLLKR
ncbi:unnamed protein product [Nippostrongylus brasiliensis]|uniref:DUF630 domain-containing protein n=1 Tax=Nippostrongylus brasiliensis TaxID=27835 RepID=A0A0N4Y7D8_NIPBR|nr:unnamed protein product [Nippostrongylus brasiliensis]